MTTETLSKLYLELHRLLPDTKTAREMELEAENERLREAVSIVGVVECDHLHHKPTDYHDTGPCPVVARYNALTETNEDS